MSGWYARAVLQVADVERAVEFYIGGLGFSEAWRHHSDDGRLLVAEVGRDGCALILSCQYPEQVGPALIFISLEAADFAAAQVEFHRNHVAVSEGWWGYPLMVVADPDGNRLYFPEPGKDDG